MRIGVRLLTLLAVSLVTLSSTLVNSSASGPRSASGPSLTAATREGAASLLANQALSGSEEESPSRWPFPRLTAVNFDQGRVPVHHALDFVFDRPIGPTTAETSFQITPPTTGEISWPNRDTLRFQPRELL